MVKTDHRCYTKEKFRNDRKDVYNMTRIEDLLAALQKRDEEKNKNTVLWILAIIGAVTAVAGIAYAVYRYLTPDYLEDFEDDFDDYFEEDLEEEKKDEAAEEDIFEEETEGKAEKTEEE